MATLKERLAADLKEAMKARERARLDALRMLTTSIKNKEVEVRRELTDEEVQAVAATEVKRRKEAADAYDDAGRSELAEKERTEQAVLESYLPEQLSGEELDALVQEAIAATGAAGPGDMGKVMGAVMGKAKGRADGSIVQAKVREALGA